MIGLGIGLVIAAGIFFGPNFLSRLTSQKVLTSPVSQISPTPSPQSTPNPLVSLTSPTDQIVAAKTIEVAGQSFPGATIIITSPADEQTVKTDDQGNFKVNLKIDEGENTILAATTDQRGALQTAKKQIILEINE